MVRLACALALLTVGCVQAAPPAVTIAPLPVAPQASVASPELPPPRVPSDYVRVSVVALVSQGGMVALADPTEEVIVPIYIGGTEAASIKHRYEHTTAERPLTHDLFDSALHELGARVIRAQVDKLENNTYFATLILKDKGRYIQLDARPSDAIALALGANAPIYCASAVITQAGVPRDNLKGL
jgi:bifunctional DNase/RNase